MRWVVAEPGTSAARPIELLKTHAQVSQRATALSRLIRLSVRVSSMRGGGRNNGVPKSWSGSIRGILPEYDLITPRKCSIERLQPPEVVGQVNRALMRLSILDRLYRPEPPTSADLQRETDH